MSLNISGEKCAVCSAYLFPEDDTVYCPECGAPHHRDCYNAIGHCGLEQYHNTENQYKKPETQANQDTKENVNSNLITCGMCGEKFCIDEAVCPNCNTPNITKAGGRFISFDFLGGVPENTDLGDGITAKEAKRFIVSNTHRYIPKFINFKNGKKVSWNWLAFLTPCGWLMSRKMYVLGAIVGAIQIAFTMLKVPFTAAVNQLDFSSAQNYMEMSQILLENISIVSTTALYAAFLGVIFDFVTRVIIAIFGDRIYKNRVISSIKEINHHSIDKEDAFRKKGGVSFIAGALGYFAVSELPTIIAYTLGML